MFDDLLNQSGLKKYELADLLGITRDTISRWQGNPPQYAIVYLELYIKHKESEVTREQVLSYLFPSKKF